MQRWKGQVQSRGRGQGLAPPAGLPEGTRAKPSTPNYPECANQISHPAYLGIGLMSEEGQECSSTGMELSGALHSTIQLNYVGKRVQRLELRLSPTCWLFMPAP